MKKEKKKKKQRSTINQMCTCVAADKITCSVGYSLGIKAIPQSIIHKINKRLTIND